MELYCVILDKVAYERRTAYIKLEKLCTIAPEYLIIVNGTDFDTLKEPIVGESESKNMWLLMHRDKEVVEDYIARM